MKNWNDGDNNNNNNTDDDNSNDDDDELRMHIDASVNECYI